MRIARFVNPQNEVKWGVVEGAPDAQADALTVAEIAEHPFGEIVTTGQRWALPDVRLLAPILPSKVLCVGRNYAAHAAEMGNDVPPSPILFLKPSTSVIGSTDTIRLPVGAGRVEHEAELAVIIGRPAKDVSRERALDYVLGYTCANDVSDRDAQADDTQWTRAKGYDSFCPIGPWIETELDPSDLAIRAEVGRGGVRELRQDARTKDMVHDVATLISFMSHVMTLLPGDVLLTGTPAGVGPIEPGDTVRVTIEGIGTLVNPVVQRKLDSA